MWSARWSDSVRLLLVILLGVAPQTAGAACQLSASGLNFGAYNVFAPIAVRSTATLTVACDETPPPRVVITIGPSAVSGLINPRRMRGGAGGDVVDYNVFVDSALSQIWGDGINGGTPVSRRVNRNRPVEFTLYGGVAAGQNVPAGLYSDTLQVTVTW
jgi:spore coat protein U-like protein